MGDAARYTGPRGTAVAINIAPDQPAAPCTLAYWLLDGSWHPVWSQFVISLVHLRPVIGHPPALLAFPGATHELAVWALDPGDPPTIYAPETIATNEVSGLSPIDVVHQFEATDEEMVQVAELCAQACVDGRLTPSTDDNRPYLREVWLGSIVQTLAHLRGEEHPHG